MVKYKRFFGDARVTAQLGIWRPWIVALVSLFPLFVTPVLPSIDFYAHVARYYALAHLAVDTTLAENYQASWRLLPNLGMDVLGTSVIKVLPPLFAAKALAGLAIIAPFAGALYLARSLQGRVTALNIALAGILTYNLVLGWGFANFLLGMGIALGGLGWWICQAAHPRRQLLVAMALAIVLLFTHGLVFGLWGLMLIGIEIMLIEKKGTIRLRPLVISMFRLILVALIPVLLFFQMKTASAEGGITVAFANLSTYSQQGLLWTRLWDEILLRFDSILRVAETSWPVWDRLFGLVLWIGLIAGLALGLVRLDRRMWLTVGLMAIMIWVMPPSLFGVGHLPERMPLILLALLAGSLSPCADRRPSQPLVMLFKSMFIVHLAMVSVGWFQEGRSYRKYLSALNEVKPGGLGAAVFTGETTLRDSSRRCKPLLFLLLLKNGTAVSTFANPTQQPLAIKGPLLAAREKASDIETFPSTVAMIEDQIRAGFNVVVTCDNVPPPLRLKTATLIAQDEEWALYQASSAP